MAGEELFIKHTKNWIKEVVIGCNFCPFAAREVARGSVDYTVLENAAQTAAVTALMKIVKTLDGDKNIETALLILPGAFTAFPTFLQLLNASERTLRKKGYVGIYQVASFHPHYLFAYSETEDPANYTNRSPYPMLQLLREESVSKAVDAYPNPETIPQRNIQFAQQKGLAHMQALLQDCFS